MYTKSECYQKVWVLVFSFMYLVSVDPMDRSYVGMTIRCCIKMGIMNLIELMKLKIYLTWFYEKSFQE